MTARLCLPLETGWRFRRLDPSEIDPALSYLPWPELGDAEDGKEADARPEQVAPRHAEGVGLRPWILPTANPLITDPSRRAARPLGAPPATPDAARIDTEDAHWEGVTVPHDWAISGPFLADGPHGGMGRLPSWGVGWYRRHLPIPAEQAGRSVLLDLDGAMSYASVWVNGTLVGGWPYGYSSWRLDLTDHLRAGQDNLLAIRLDNPPRSARWYPGGGLFRPVRLTIADPVHVAQWGQRVTTPEVSAHSTLVDVEVTLENLGAEPATVEATTEIIALPAGGADDPAAQHAESGAVDSADVATAQHAEAGDVVGRIVHPRITVPAGGTATERGALRVQDPALWGPPPTQTPHRYLASTTVRRDGAVLDEDRTVFGIRSIAFDADQGLLVNGEKIPIQGVNTHHDLGALGAAFHPRAAERQLEILQEMGVNAVRTAHNPPAPDLLDIADRRGLLVLDELFDSWYARKTDLDFHLIFEEWHEPDLRAMIRRDRHHPSVILWGIGNEVGEQYTGQEGAQIARRLVGIAHDEDPSRLTTTAMNYAKPHMPLPAEVDVIGINYQGEGIRQEPEFEGTDRIRTPPQYPLFRAAFPDRAILGTETASALSTRGTYLFPVATARSGPARDGAGADDATCRVSAYELHAVDFGSTAEKVFATLDEHPYVAGEFVWTGFDYLGEPTPYYSARSSYTGIVDLAGFPKDRFWLYQSRWRPDLPMAHLLPHWTWPGREGLVTPVHVVTSGDEAELFVNGVSQGRRRKTTGEHRLRWDDIVYEPGELHVRTLRDGEPWAEDTVRTAGPAHHLELETDRDRIAADGKDLAFLSARVVDVHGTPVPAADHALTFTLGRPGRSAAAGAGHPADLPAELVATDNGDPTDLVAFPSPTRRAFSGRALGIVRAGRETSGTVMITVTAEDLEPAAVTVRVGA